MLQIEVGKLVVDMDVLPRVLNFVHVSTMKNAALSGVTFPAIVVEKGTNRIVSGLHRYFMYKDLHGLDYEVDVEEMTFADDNELYLFAVQQNQAHGLGYSTYDRRKILVEAERRGITREVIADALKMPVDSGTRMLDSGSAFKKTPAGGQERVALRTAMKPLAGRMLNKRQQEANNRANMKAEHHAASLISLLRAGLMTWGSKGAVSSVGMLKRELDKQLS
jgi:hypothetical protein